MKHWVFDLDGTLVDSLPAHFEVVETIFKTFNRPFSKENHHEVLKATAKTFAVFLEKHVGHKNLPLALAMFHELTNEALKTIRPFTGIEDVLKTLKSKQHHLAVWTARDLIVTEQILKHSGLSPYFSVCISGTCTAQAKPHPEGLQRIATHFNSDTSSMLMVGDFDSDMLGAQAFGIKAVRVNWHSLNSQPATSPCAIATWQFHKVSDFHEWIETKDS